MVRRRLARAADGGAPPLVARLDDQLRASRRFDFAVGEGAVFFALTELQGDRWTAAP